MYIYCFYLCSQSSSICLAAAEETFPFPSTINFFFIEKSILFYRKHRQFIALPNLFVKLTLFVGANSIGSSSGRAPIPVLHRRRTLLLQVPNPDTGTTDIADELFSLYSFGKSITFRGEDTSTRNDQRKLKKKT